MAVVAAVTAIRPFELQQTKVSCSKMLAFGGHVGYWDYWWLAVAADCPSRDETRSPLESTGWPKKREKTY